MRKLLIILFLFAACALKAQYTPNSGAYSYKGLMPLKSLQLPTDCGYPVTAIHAPDSSRAAIYFDSCDALLYRFDPQPKTWSIVGGTGIDSLFITNTDSIFIISEGDTIFVGINDDGCTNGIKQPGYVTWSGDGLAFDVTAGFFTLDCTLYDGNAGSITLDPADPTFARFDVIGWDTTGAVIKVTGTAGMNPAIPQVDPSYQIGLTVINIPAGATVPGGITQDVIYDENNEDWTGAVSGITVNLDNTTNPYHLTKSADAGTWSPAPKTLTFTNDTGYIDANDYGILKLFISLKESIAAVGNIRVSFLNDGDAVSNIVSLGGGVGFNKSIADTYQNISVPLSSFIFTSTVFNQVRITFAGSGDGAYIDYIQLQGGITPPSIAGVYQDTTYSRNDSLFGRKNNTEFFIQHLTLARLPQLWGIYINNDDSTYDPYGVDVGIGVDSALLKDWIINTVIDNDTTITNILDDIDYVVDTISNSPPVGAVNGDKVLVGTSPTGAFAGHANEVAELVGGVWTFTIPTTGESLQVRNSTQLLFYKFDGSNWNLMSVGWVVGGNQGITDPTIGVKDSTSVSVITNNIPAIVVDANQNVKLPMYSGLEDSSIYFRPGEDGKVDTGYFNQLIAGTGITITPGPNRTDTIKSTGGGGSVTVESDGKSDIDSNLVYNGGTFKKASPLGYINIMDYNAINDSTGGNYAAITAAIAALPARGGKIYFPPGRYRCDTTIVVNKPVIFEGAGSSVFRQDQVYGLSASKIFTTSTTINLFNVTNDGAVFNHIEISNAAANPTQGTGIYINMQGGFKILNSYIRDFYNNIEIVNGYHYIIQNSTIAGAVNYGIRIRDSVIVDAGDGLIDGCMFYNGQHFTNTYIRQESGGGLKISNCKFNNSPQYCYYGEFATGVFTGLLIFTGNSFENYVRAIRLTGNGYFSGQIVVSGNEFSNFNASATCDVYLTGVTSDPTTITSNTFRAAHAADTAIFTSFIGNLAVSNAYRDYTTPTVYDNSINTIVDNASTTTQYGLMASASPTTGELTQVSGLGTVGQLLTSNGAGALPTWQTPSSGGTINGLAQRMAFYSGASSLSYGNYIVDTANTRMAIGSIAPNNSFELDSARSVGINTTSVPAGGIKLWSSTDRVTNTSGMRMYVGSSANSYSGYIMVFPEATGTRAGTASQLYLNNMNTYIQYNGELFAPSATVSGQLTGNFGTFSNILAAVDFQSSSGVNNSTNIATFLAQNSSSADQVGIVLGPQNLQTGTAEFHAVRIAPYYNTFSSSGRQTLFEVGERANATPTSTFTGVFSIDRAGSVLVGTSTAVPSAKLAIESTTQGLLLPRMTKAQRDAISSPVAGLAVYQTDNTPGLRVYNGTNWMRYTETAD